MGVVYLAHDPELDRKVAIKVLHPGRSGSIEMLRARLQREAQAMARLSHPNVVSIYDVGVDAGRLFLAMELVEGTTLRQWQGATGRSWREVVACYLEAGRGLSAAHSAGLIHRDFKADNVLISANGAALVADFGLAHLEDGTPASGIEGALAAGTPAYMAPEQWLGRPVDARVDQFAFCVALYEGLYGVLPFGAAPAVDDRVRRTVSDEHSMPTTPPLWSQRDERCVRTLSGQLLPPPRTSQVPPAIARALARGLAREPAERYASLRELLDRLERLTRPASSRRSQWMGGLALGAVVATLAWWLTSGSAGRAADPCADAAAPAAAVWGPQRVSSLRAAFEATRRAGAGETARRVERELTGYRDRWAEMRRQACQATRRGVQSAALLDLRMACLDRRLGELGGVISALTGAAGGADASGAWLDQAIEAAQGLTPLTACADARELTEATPLPAGAAARAEVLALEARLDAVDGLHRTGAYRQAIAQLEPLLEEARRRGHAPTLARALELYALLSRQTDAAAAAETAAREAVRVAAASRSSAIEAAAWMDLLFVIGHFDGRAGEALALQPAAESAVARVADPRLRARLAVTIGRILVEHGDDRKALEVVTPALQLAGAELGLDHLDRIALLQMLGGAQYRLGEMELALATNREVLAARERVLGADHPSVGVALTATGVCLNALGRYVEARQDLERAVSILEAAFGPDHSQVATALNNLAGSVSEEGKFEEARRLFERVVAIRERIYGADSEPVASGLGNVGQMLIEQGRGEEAERLLRRSLAIREAKFGPEHQRLVPTLSNLAWALDITGRCAQAVPTYDRAVAIAEKHYGRDHELVASPLSGRGLCLIARAPHAAVRDLERAVALQKDERDPALLAMTRFGLARALRRLGGDQERARQLAAQARGYYAGLDDTEELAKIDAWLGGR